MNAPILVLSCESSSIKFALFDGDIDPLPRKPLWAGKVDGIGSNAKLILGRAELVALVLGPAKPDHAALQYVRASVEEQTHARLPAVCNGAHGTTRSRASAIPAGSEA